MSKKKKQSRSVAIIGMGCLFPKARDIKEFWRLLFKGEDGITEIPETHWSVKDYYHKDPKYPDHTYCRRGGFIPPVSYDPAEFGIPPNTLEATDTSQLLSLVIAKRALEDAGYGSDRKFNHEKTSVILGATGTQELVIPLGARLGHPIWRKALLDSGVAQDQAEEVIERISKSYVSWQENSFPGLLGNVIAGRITNRLDLGGTNCVVDAACASSMGAVNLAMLELLSGRCDMTVTGGVDTLNDIFMHMCFSQTGVLSHTSDAKPFSEDADGTVLGEGIGLLVMKRLQDAEKDGDRIYAVIKSIGSSSDGKSQSIYAPNAAGQAKALRMAYQEADVTPGTIELIEAHGTGTRVGDAVEFSALKEVFTEYGNKENKCALGSVKSSIGHAKAAAGAAGLIKAALALYHKVLPATLKAEKPDPKLNIHESPFYLNISTRPWVSHKDHPRRSGISAFGFGGSNYHVVLEEYKPGKQEPSWDGTVAISAISGSSRNNIIASLEGLLKNIEQISTFEEILLATSKNNALFSANEDYRLLIVLERPEQHDKQTESTLEILRQALNLLKKEDAENFSVNNIYFRGPRKKGGLAFLFPGQGSQYTDMGKDLISIFPEALDIMEKANIIHRTATGDKTVRLSDLVYPLPFTDRKANEEKLRSTDTAQPAIGAISLGMLKILERFGVQPDAVGGHSFGELTALCASGRIDEDTFLSLAVKRGKYMASAGNGDTTMLAVKAPLQELENLIQANNLDVVLANRNAPAQGVLSGSTNAIHEAQKICKEKGFRSVLLPVAAAFHSRHVDKAAKPFKQAAQSATIKPSPIPVYSNTTGSPYPDDSQKAAAILGDQLLNPVNFITGIENLYQSGVRTFMEIGPKPVLSGLIDSILAGKEFNTISLDSSSGKKSGLFDLAHALCRLAAEGYEIDLSKWENPMAAPKKQKISIPITGANYRSDYTQKPPKPKTAAQDVFVSSAAVNPPEAQKSKTISSAVTPESVSDATLFQKKTAGIPNKPEKAVRASASNTGAIAEALKVVSESLKSMQALQTQTAETHKKFLETQSDASRNLQKMMERTRSLAEASLGLRPLLPETDYLQTAPSADLLSEKTEHFKTETILETALLSSDRSDHEISAAEKTDLIRVDSKDIKSNILDVVSELTGYPVEMLETDMDIEADLGIDSIKRVEILSTLEEKLPNIGPISPEMLGEMKTLGQIIDYLSQANEKNSPAPETLETASTHSRNKMENAMLQVVSELTGYPVEMLEPDMDIEADLGIDSIKRVEILSAFEEKMPGLPPISTEMMGELKTLGQIIDYLAELSGTCRTEVLAAASPGSRDQMEQTMLQVVSELTGYPMEMLEPAMDIEADLGIDSIKRVEILSAFEEKMPGLPPISTEMMGELKTLGQIIDYLAELSGTPKPDKNLQMDHGEDSSLDVSYTYPSESKEQPEVILEDVERQVVSLVEKPFNRGRQLVVPKDRIVYILDDQTGLGKEIAVVLENRDIRTELIPGDLFADTDSLKDNLRNAGGLILIPDVDLLTDKFNQKTIWNEKDVQFLKNSFIAASLAAKEIIQSASNGGGLLAAITRLDGCLGFSGKGVLHPIQGGLAGLVKTASMEWENVCCHAIDIAPAWKDNKEAALAAVDEILNPGPVEVGLHKNSRYLLMLAPSTSPEGKILLEEKDVVLVTGGARGITAACSYTLAKHAKPTIILMGRSPLPAPEPHWIEGITDEAAIKKSIIQNEFFGQKVTPVQVDSVFNQYMAGREINRNLSRLKSTGATIDYIPLDVRNADSVISVLEEIRNNYGPIRGLIHGAGVLEDRFIVDKTIEQFNRVFDTKVKGLQVLLEATREDKLKTIVLFSSVAARMGNKGQVDYAMANEVLNKIAQHEAFSRKECRVISINWGPWDGGMVTASLKKEFSRMNVSLIPIKAGAMSMLYEMMGGKECPVEVVIGATLSTNPKEDAAARENQAKSTPFEQEIDITNYPILESHVLAGRPVVPFAIMSEWFGHAAISWNPNLSLFGIDDMRLLSGIKLDKTKKKIRLIPGKFTQKDEFLEIDMELVNGFQNNTRTIYSKARVVLCNKPSPAPAFEVSGRIGEKTYSKTIEEAYEKVLFHGNMLRGIHRIEGYSEKGMIAELVSAPKPEKWITNPYRDRWLGDPLVMDAAYQMAILWCHEITGLVSLPSYSEAYRQYQKTFPENGIQAVLEVSELTDHKMKGDFTFLDKSKTVVATITGYEAVMDAALMKAFKNA